MKFVSVLLGAGLLVPAFGQTGVIAQGNVTLERFAFYWQTRLEPPSPPMANTLGYGSGVNDKTGNIYRVMIDRVTRTYFGYEVRAEPLAQRNEYRVTFHPLDLSPKVLQSIHIDDPATWNKREIGAAAARPLYPYRDAPDTVHTLDVIAVDLLVNQETRQKIVDYVVLQEPSHSGWTFDMPIRREFTYTPEIAHVSGRIAAEFDMTGAITIQGTVTRAEWMNPHALVWVETKNADATVSLWELELPPPNTLKRMFGRSGDANVPGIGFLKPGDQIGFTLWRAKDGSFLGHALALALPDGRVVSLPHGWP